MLIYAIVTITLALVFYTIGVWAEKIQGELKKWHFFMFGIGFIFDSIGTALMSKIAGDGLTLNFHAITGLLAIILMFIHAIWAARVLTINNQTVRRNFHKFSFLVWLIWLLPFTSGAIFGMAK